MCGIVGTNFSSKEFDSSVELLKHRGPDNQTSISYKNNQFGHTRLSIIDLDNEANQPMEFDDIIITFNGEIYNFQELIKNENLHCITKSDTEVLIRLYQKYDTDFLNKLNGMFSFCIYDKKKDKFFCARDRFGKKPFYYYFKDGKFIYASEIKSILLLIENKVNINKEAIYEYLEYGSSIAPNTIYENIYKLKHSCFLTVSENELEIDYYYDYANFKTAVYDEKTAVKKIEDTLIKSLEYRLVSDVEIGSFLSGGLDSSLLSSMYSNITNQKINTFSIGYNEHKNYCELNYAEKASKHVKSNHHQFTIDKNDFLSTIDSFINIMDEPFADSASIPTYLLSKFTHQHNIKVALSGEGSDEIFLGYDLYHNLLKSKNEYSGFNKGFESNLNKNFKSSYNYPNQFSYIDLNIWVPEILMNKVDKMAMASSLEVRSPFLDHNLVSLLFSIDDKIKVGNTNKYLLKKVAKKYLPDEIIHRRKKGFSSPYIEWIEQEYNINLKDYIIKNLIKSDIFSFKEIEYSKNYDFNNKQKTWTLFILAKWLENRG